MSYPPALRRSLRLATAIVVGASALLVACDDGATDDADSPSPAAATSSTGATPPAPGAPPPPMNTATPTTAPPSDDAYGVAVLDLASGEVSVLYEGAEPFFVRDALGPNALDFSRAIWLSPTTEEARRYEPSGEFFEQVEGWDVLTAPDGQTRSYLVGDPAAMDATLTLVVEGDDYRHEVPVDRARWRTFSPDGTQLAWLGRSSLHILHFDTGETHEVVAAALPPLAWSPSGDYLAYVSAPAGGAEVARMDGEYETVVIFGELNHPDSWAVLEDGEYLLTNQGGVPVLTPMEAGEEIRVAFEGAEIAWVLGDSLVIATSGVGVSRMTIVFEAATGNVVRELHGDTDVVLTPQGVASATIARSELACTGIDIVHPLATRQLPCDATHAHWSPDGRYLALIPISSAAPVEILDVISGQVREVPHAGTYGTIPRWSADGRYLVWMWMPTP